MKAHLKEYAQYKYCIELSYEIIIPQCIRIWLIIKDSPYEISHILYVNKSIKSNVVAFEFHEDALYFIAWMEHLEADQLELPL